MRTLTLICSLIIFSSPFASQAQSQRHPKQEEDVTVHRMQEDLAKKRNKERQVELKKDTDHLFELATQLKKQVDESNENVMSLDVIRTAEKIEKLAKSVREKMKADAYAPAVQ